MATLTQTAYQVRRAINWVIFAVVLYVVLRFLYGGILFLYHSAFPSKAPPANHAFGVLPKPIFPNKDNALKLTFTLETIQGGFPAASSSAIVYFMPKKPANLLALTQTQQFAKKLELDPKPIQETKNIYRFDDGELLFRRLRYDIVSDNFILRYAFEQDLSVFTERRIPTPDLALDLANSLLRDNSLLANDFTGEKTNITFLKLTGATLNETSSLSQADAIRVDYFRNTIGGVPLVTSFPKEGPIAFVFSGAANPKKQLLQFAYTYWPIDQEHTGTYELKTSQQAWEELQNGNGYIGVYPKTGTDVIVRNIYLAYYDSFDPQMYLQPVYVFEGDDGFIAYVPAVTAQWTE